MKFWLVYLLLWNIPAIGFADLIDSIEEIKKEKPVPPKEDPEGPGPEPKESEAGRSKPVPPSRPVPTEKPKKANAKKATDKDSKRSPIRLKSDGRSTYSKKGGVIHLVENVVITQDDLRFQADEAKVFVKDGENTEGNVERVEVTGNVRVAKFSENPAEKISARGDKAFFHNEDRKVVLVGNARLWQGGHLIKGKQITYEIDTGMITVDKAEGVVQPENKDEKETPPGK